MGASVGILTASFIRAWEGESRTAYLDIVGVPTVCVGHTGPDIQPNRLYTESECEQLLMRDLQMHVGVMLRYITVPLSEGETTAYSSLVFNIGVGAFVSSTLLKLLNSGQRLDACKQLLRWVRAGGKVVRGLQNRRRAEYKLCITPDVKVAAR